MSEKKSRDTAERHNRDAHKSEHAAAAAEVVAFPLFEVHDAVLLIIEPDSGKIVNANIAAQNYYGYPVETLKRMRIQDINTLPEDKVIEKFKQAANEKRNYFEFPHRLANGEIRTVEVHSSPIIINGQKYLLSIIHDVTARKLAEQQRDQLIEKLQKALSEVKTLQGFLPICAYCKKIRDDDGYWNQIETYIDEHSQAKFSHGICPECAEKYHPRFRPVENTNSRPPGSE